MILASQSPRRKALLESAGFELEVVPANVDETRHEGEKPVELVERLSRLKAQTVLDALDRQPADGLLVAADTIVWMGDTALGKPNGPEDAARMLAELSGRTHHVSTGVCVMALAADGVLAEQVNFVETTDVTFWELTRREIDAYVATGEPLDKAGAYAIQGTGRLFVRSISGDYDNVVGLPLARLVRAVAALDSAHEDLVARLITRGGPHA